MSYNSISCDCKIYMNYMKQKSVDVDMTATTKADVKFIHLHNYGGSADFSLLEGYPNLGFAPKIFTVDGHIDERISCFLSDNLLRMTFVKTEKSKTFLFWKKHRICKCLIYTIYRELQHYRFQNCRSFPFLVSVDCIS